MTRQESFKHWVRSRMATTGERYAESRRVLLERSEASSSERSWVAAPDVADDAIRSRTGKGWDAWCDLIDLYPGRTDGHTAIASYVRDDLGVDPWWAQAVTVGYERISGLRLPHQMPDGTFTANRSGTVEVDADQLRRHLLDDDDRADVFPGHPTALQSKPTAKAIRVSVGPGIATIRLEDRGNGRTKVTVQHERLPDFGAVEQWKFYWSDWLEAIDESSESEI